MSGTSARPLRGSGLRGPASVWLALCVVSGVAGCVDSKTQQCRWGDVCPTGMYCDDTWRRCLFPGQVEACDGLPERAECSFPNAPEGDYGCSGGLCLLSFCGDGLVGPLEMCDDGGHEDGDGCSADCLSDETCGNGRRDAVRGEGCDDGNLQSHDGCTSGCTLEFPTWRLQSSHLPPRYGSDAVYDESRGVLVMFGGMTGTGTVYNDTWEFDGLHWTERRVDAPPAQRMDHAVAYDALRQRVVLHAGWTGMEALQDTWEYYGGEWSAVVTAHAPPLRSSHGMVYDAARERVVVFGGEEASRDCLGDTWEFDGADWTQVTPAVSPPARRYLDLAYDPVRERVVLFGGSSGNPSWTFHADTWEYDGTSWTQVSPPSAPPPRHGHRLAWDATAQRVVLFGGLGADNTVRNDLWTYDGSAWTEVPLSPRPLGRLQFSMGYDPTRAQLIVQGGMDETYTTRDDTWALADGAWSELQLLVPAARLGAAMAHQALQGHVVLFGGTTDYDQPFLLTGTWLYDGVFWNEATPTVTPPLRYMHAMAYDSARHVSVLYGGVSAAMALADTWEWTGTRWEQRSPTVSPPARVAHAMAYDAARGQVVLHGGAIGQSYYDETWLYDGATWTRVADPGPRRAFHALAYDERRERVVLFGGTDGDITFDETWEWDGTSWERRAPLASPGARAIFGMVYHAARGTIVLFGGNGTPGLYTDTWEYDGTTWAPINAVGGGWERAEMAAAYHATTRSVVMFGGVELLGLAEADTWRYRYEGAWPDEVCDNALDDDSDGLVDCDDPDCDHVRCGPGSYCIYGVCQ